MNIHEKNYKSGSGHESCKAEHLSSSIDKTHYILSNPSHSSQAYIPQKYLKPKI